MSTKKSILSAAVAGILSGVMATTVLAAKKNTAQDFNKKEVEPCFGINSCKGQGQCGGKGTSCAATNACKGQGWINVEKGHCLNIEGGSLTPKEEK